MSNDFPQAVGVRADWRDLPDAIRSAIEDRLGATVTDVVSQSGGFSPGLAARCDLSNGDRVFLKAADPAVNPDTPHFHRAEAAIAAQLPVVVPAPRLLWQLDASGWAILCFECVDGHQPRVPWLPDELEQVLAAIDTMSEHLTPAPLTAPPVAERLASSFSRFTRFVEERDSGRDLTAVDPWVVEHLDRLASLESTWTEGAAGTTLLHSDLRADNMLLSGDRVVFVDWPHVCIGAPWFDLMGFLRRSLCKAAAIRSNISCPRRWGAQRIPKQ